MQQCAMRIITCSAVILWSSVLPRWVHSVLLVVSKSEDMRSGGGQRQMDGKGRHSDGTKRGCMAEFTTNVAHSVQGTFIARTPRMLSVQKVCEQKG